MKTFKFSILIITIAIIKILAYSNFEFSNHLLNVFSKLTLSFSILYSIYFIIKNTINKSIKSIYLNLGFICLTAFSSFLIISNEKSPVKIIHKSDNSWVEIYSMDRTVCICTESPEYCDEFCKESFIVQKIGIFNKKTKL